jgi:CheY-like chemotaxis protein
MVIPKKIYLVDDDSDDRLFIKNAFKELQIEVNIIEAGNGYELLQLLEEENDLISMIILDMNMPRMNGLETLTTLKSHPVFNKIPIVMLSTASDLNLISSAYESGVYNYVSKPVSHDAYIDFIKFLKLHFSL